MKSNIILTRLNYSTYIINSQLYSTTGDYGCNYPINQEWIGNLATASVGDEILVVSGGLLDLLPTSLSTNIPTFKYMATLGGAVFEIEYIINDTTAKLKTPSAYSVGDDPIFSVYWTGQPVVEQTYIMDASSGGFGVMGCVINNKMESLPVDIPAAFDVPVGTEPIMINFQATGVDVAINISLL